MVKSYRYEYSLSPYFEHECKQGRISIRRNHRHRMKQYLKGVGNNNMYCSNSDLNRHQSDCKTLLHERGRAMKRDITLIICAYLWNIGLIILTGVLCIHFNSLWGILALIFAKAISTSDENKKTD